MLIFKIHVALMFQALQGGRGDDEIKPKKAKKWLKNVFRCLVQSLVLYLHIFLKTESSLIGILFTLISELFWRYNFGAFRAKYFKVFFSKDV